MKTKELIHRLQEADPSGEMDCCVSNADIFFVDVEPAYWDGCLQVLIRDPAKSPYYDVVGAKYVSSGKKLVIRPLSISDAIFENEKLPVDYEDLAPSWQERYKNMVEERRKETNEISNGVENGIFVEYITRRYAGQFGEDFRVEEVRDAATEFYKANMSYLDDMPQDILKKRVKETIDGKEVEVIPSWNDRRREQWDREIKLDFENGKFVLKKRPLYEIVSNNPNSWEPVDENK